MFSSSSPATRRQLLQRSGLIIGVIASQTFLPAWDAQAQLNKKDMEEILAVLLRELALDKTSYRVREKVRGRFAIVNEDSRPVVLRVGFHIANSDNTIEDSAQRQIHIPARKPLIAPIAPLSSPQEGEKKYTITAVGRELEADFNVWR